MKLMELLTKKRMWLCVIYSYERHLHLRFDPIKLKITCFSHSKFELMGGHSRNNLPQYKQKPNEHSMNACSSGECHTVWLVDSPAFFFASSIVESITGVGESPCIQRSSQRIDSQPHHHTTKARCCSFDTFWFHIEHADARIHVMHMCWCAS